jgi:hypothetical protein
MGIVGWIVVVCLVLGLIATLFEWIIDHIVPVLILVVTVVGLIFWTKGTIIMAEIAGVGYAIYKFVDSKGTAITTSFKAKREKRKENSRLAKELKDKQQYEKKAISQMPDSSKRIVDEIDTYLTVLGGHKKYIQDSEMIAVVEDYEKTVKDLRNKVIEKPESATKLQKMINYYLPTSSKLIGKYVDYASETDDQSRKMANEIKGTVSSLDRALEKLLKDLGMDDDWDVMSDISVMKQMIENDGLSELNGINNIKKERISQKEG